MLSFCRDSFLESFQRNKLSETNETLPKNPEVIQGWKRFFQIRSIKRYKIVKRDQINKRNEIGIILVEIGKINEVSQVNQTN